MRSLIVLVLLTAPALADPPKPNTPEAMHSDDCARAHARNRPCVLNMNSIDVRGQAATGGGTSIAAIETTKQPSLVRPRKDFIVEILRSAEDL